MGVSSATWLLVPGLAWAILATLAPARVAIPIVLSVLTGSLVLLVLVPERSLRRLMAKVELRPPEADGEGERAYAAAYAVARRSGEDEAAVRAVLDRAAEALALSEEEARRIEREVDAQARAKEEGFSASGNVSTTFPEGRQKGEIP